MKAAIAVLTTTATATAAITAFAAAAAATAITAPATTAKRRTSVRYHCGGWPEEVNSCFLNSCMVYL